MTTAWRDLKHRGDPARVARLVELELRRYDRIWWKLRRLLDRGAAS